MRSYMDLMDKEVAKSTLSKSFPSVRKILLRRLTYQSSWIFFTFLFRIAGWISSASQHWHGCYGQYSQILRRAMRWKWSGWKFTALHGFENWFREKDLIITLNLGVFCDVINFNSITLFWINCFTLHCECFESFLVTAYNLFLMKIILNKEWCTI